MTSRCHCAHRPFTCCSGRHRTVTLPARFLLSFSFLSLRHVSKTSVWASHIKRPDALTRSALCSAGGIRGVAREGLWGS